MRYLVPFKIFESSSPLLDIKGNVDSNLISKIESLSPSSILEISCGNGSDSIELSNKGYDVEATDNNKEYVLNYYKQYYKNMCIFIKYY